MRSNIKEYLTLFSNTGNIKVVVKFKDQSGSIASQIMQAEEFKHFISDDRQEFMKSLTFDEHPFEVAKYEIEPIKNRLTLHVRRVRY